MTKLEKVQFVTNALKIAYPEASCSLDYENPVQLLIATRLAAQCTDARVNIVTKELFKKNKTAEDFANLEITTIEKYIKPCGFFRVKARDIKAMCEILSRDFGGKVPDTIEQLLSLPGVGRKTANLIIGDIYSKPAIVVDTHCIRLTKRIGIHDEKNPEKIENILRGLLLPSDANNFCHRLVMHGRGVCTAKNPRCQNCCISDFCDYSFQK